MKHKEAVNVIRLSDVEPKEIKWLWKYFIPFGKVTIIYGEPGKGKSILACDIAAKVSQGKSFTDDTEIESGNVIYQNAEDGLADTIKPRLLRAGADCDRIITIDETLHSLSMTDDLLEEKIAENEAKLVILDPIQAYLGEANINNASAVEANMKKLSQLAEKYGCAIVLIGHLNKSRSNSSYARGLGSLCFRSAARSVLLVGNDPNDEFVRVVMQVKTNLNTPPKPQAFCIEDGAIRWLGDMDITEKEILSGKRNECSKMSAAMELISETLKENKEMESKDMFLLGKAQGISERTMKSAKKELGLSSKKVQNRWVWFINPEK